MTKLTSAIEVALNGFLGALLGMGYRGSGWTEEELESFQELLKKGFVREIEAEDSVS